MEQHTPEWYRFRLGRITGSMAGLLMKSSKSKPFTDTAETYLYQLAAERTMDSRFVTNDTLLQEYIDYSDISTRAMRFGTDQEPIARLMYSSVYNVTVEEVGSIQHPTLGFFASSPDGIWSIGGQQICLEIKCPNQSTFIKYAHQIKDAPSLKSTKPEYYWQCLAHMAVTGAIRTDFTAFCPWQQNPLHIVPVHRDEVEITQLLDRVQLANQFIENIINELNNF